MARVFLSYSRDARRYVPLIERMLDLHRIGCRADDGDPGSALRSADHLLVVVTRGAVAADRVGREVATFVAANPAGRITPLVFDDVDPADVLDGLGAYPAVSFADDLDAGFAELVERVFGVPYLQASERRVVGADRRGTERRRHERRRATVSQRLRTGMWKQYAVSTGHGEYEEFGAEEAGVPVPRPDRGRDRTTAILRLADMFAAEGSELSRYTFSDPATGEPVAIDRDLLAELARRALGELEARGRADNIYVVEEVAHALLRRFRVAVKDRRHNDRRAGADRRPG